ncbi:ABC transporter permease [Alienimonas californiensis]|uniref:Transport permease protein n=1 Tax=Alienimonas californiensis TaxID=2527989 RepID=A0A517PFL9_9PLAN|nr:ABC transporter permease [Alienimonas californiensis]QDT18170.1 ABC-2 type transporter [Alienimonas californiensis]
MSALVITAKDLLLLVRDRRTAAMLLILPLSFIAIIGLTTGRLPGLGGAAPAVRVVVADAIDYDAIGAGGFEDPPDAPPAPDLLPSPAFPPAEAAAERTKAHNTVAEVLEGLNAKEVGGIRADTPEHWATILDDHLAGSLPDDPAEAARALVDRGLVDQAVIFGPSFYRRAYTVDADALFGSNEGPLANGNLAPLDVTLYSGDEEEPSGGIRLAVAGLVIPRLGRLLICRNPRAATALPGACDRIAAEANAPPREIPLSTPPAGGGVVSNVYDEIVPGYTVMFVFFLVNLMARSFLYERDLGTLRRLRTTPVRPTSILIGKTLPFYLISLAQTAILFLTGKALFGMEWGPRPWLLLPIVLACSAAATGLGLLVATLVDSEAQVSAYATSTVILLAGISGCFMPRDWLPESVQTLSLATPHAWALIGYDQVLATPRPDAGRVFECAGALCAFAAVFLALGAWRFGRRTV